MTIKLFARYHAEHISYSIDCKKSDTHILTKKYFRWENYNNILWRIALTAFTIPFPEVCVTFVSSCSSASTLHIPFYHRSTTNVSIRSWKLIQWYIFINYIYLRQLVPTPPSERYCTTILLYYNVTKLIRKIYSFFRLVARNVITPIKFETRFTETFAKQRISKHGGSIVSTIQTGEG